MQRFVTVTTGATRYLTDVPLFAERRRKLLDVAEHCPLHRTLAAGIELHTVAKERTT